MAAVKFDPKVKERIAHDLDMATRDWQVVAGLQDGDEVFMEHFLADWPVVEDRMRRLAQWKREGTMTPAQVRQYSALMELERKYRPVVERLAV